MGCVRLCAVNISKNEEKKAKRRLEDIALGEPTMKYKLIGGIGAGKPTARRCGL